MKDFCFKFDWYSFKMFFKSLFKLKLKDAKRHFKEINLYNDESEDLIKDLMKEKYLCIKN